MKKSSLHEERRINVSEPFFPPLQEYNEFLRQIWDKKWITNNGPMVQRLELELMSKLKTNNLSFVTNGTIAIQLALKALGVQGEVITTPFSYVATSSSIYWEGCRPVFVDINQKTLNIDPTKIEEKINENTKAILATHVYGNPCDIDAIQNISEKYNLKVIYDAAHAFDVSYKGKSIFEYGDISTCSTHATKLFHTCEGGFVVCKNQDSLEKINFMKNFGHNGPFVFETVGINGKNSELHASIGLLNLRYIDIIQSKRKEVSDRYDENLKNTNLIKPAWNRYSQPNFSYYPIIFKDEETLLKSDIELQKNKIFGRRYFYPSLPNSLPYVDNCDLEITDEISKRIFCLPLHHNISNNDVDFITSLLLKIINC